MYRNSTEIRYGKYSRVKSKLVMAIKLSLFMCLAAIVQVSTASASRKIAIDKNNNNTSVNTLTDQAAITITGTVTDEKNQPLAGVTVKVENTSTGITTNSNGRYSISVPNGNSVLVFSYIGFTTQRQAVGNKKVIDVSLAEVNSNLNEVVVVGYGTVKRKDLTGTVSTVKATELENQHPNSVNDLLRGNVAGVNVGFNATPTGGENGDFTIRGKGSLTASNTPLFVLNGVIYPGDIKDINPNDIETIDILKDASAAAVFGSKASNGVIIITTKKGKAGKPRITINSTAGWASQEVHNPIYDGPGYVAYRSQVLYSINSNVPAATADLAFSDPRTLPSSVSLAQWYSYDGAKPGGDDVAVWLARLRMQPIEIKNYEAGKVTDWQKLGFINGMRQDHNMSISGRGESSNYYLSGGYTNNQGVVLGEDFKNARGKMSVEAKAASFATVGVDLTYSARDQGAVAADKTQIRNQSPYGDEFNADGTLKSYPNDDPGNTSNPFNDYTYYTHVLRYNEIFARLYLKGDLPAGFDYSVTLSPHYTQGRDYQDHNAIESTVSAVGGTAARINTTGFDWQLDNILHWNKTIAKIHAFDVTLLYNVTKSNSWQDEMHNQGFDPNDYLSYHNMGAGILPSILSNDGVQTGLAMMARVNYTLMGKYLLTGTIRRDGSSLFGQKYPYGTFPLIAAAWNFSDENFAKKFTWLNSGKLRLSYGTVGNSGISNYTSLQDLTSGKYEYVNASGTAINATQLYTNRQSNPNLKWESNTAFNAGLDLTMFNNRITTSINVYNKRTSNLLVNRALPTITGFANVTTNLGAVQDRGIELELTTRNIIKEKFTWNTSFNFSYNQNKILHLYGLQNVLDATGHIIGQAELNDPGNNWFIGKDVNVIWNYRVLGVWQTNQAADAAKVGQRPGDFHIQDVNGDNKYTDDDKQFLGTTNAPYLASMRNSFTFLKNFDFSFSMYSKWGALANFDEAKNNVGFQDRQNSQILPYWTPTNPINDYARVYSSNGSATFNVFRNPSFIRLDNVSLAYTIPKDIVQKLHIENIKVFGTVQNAAIFQPQWNYWDAENKDITPRYVTFGLNVTL